MRNCYSFFSGIVLVVLAASSCTVYQPLQSSLPPVHKKGEAAIRASYQVPYIGQVTGAWSPVPHGLVFASGGLHVHNAARDSSNKYARSRQYEAGLGAYTTLGNIWLSGSVGAGQGRGYRYGRFAPVDGPNFGVAIPFPGSGAGPRTYKPIPELLGHYNTRFVQMMAQWRNEQAKGLEWGTSIRLNEVRFTDLTLNSIKQSLPVQRMLQAELTAQYPWRRLTWQAAAVYAPALGRVSDERVFARAPLRLWLGVVFQPSHKK